MGSDSSPFVLVSNICHQKEYCPQEERSRIMVIHEPVKIFPLLSWQPVLVWWRNPYNPDKILTFDNIEAGDI